MKKFMFNDACGLTQAVLERRKTQTRRICSTQPPYEKNDIAFPCDWVDEDNPEKDPLYGAYCWVNRDNPFEHSGWIKPSYKIGEIVAIAQSYLKIAEELEDCNNASCAEHFEKNVRSASWYMGSWGHPGFRNKMFTSADRMIHQIRITKVRIERLQDISDDDCLAEGIIKKWHAPVGRNYYYITDKEVYSTKDVYNTPREAYASLIDKVGKKGDWDKNPYVFVYDFELVK